MFAHSIGAEEPRLFPSEAFDEAQRVAEEDAELEPGGGDEGQMELFAPVTFVISGTFQVGSLKVGLCTPLVSPKGSQFFFFSDPQQVVEF